jgi:hypothetical protein
MLPRWFRVVLATEIAGLATFVFVGLHVLGQGVHSARDALTWLQPAQSARPSPPATPILSLTSTAAPVPLRAAYGAAMLSPSLLVRLNRDTGATALGEYALLLQLEAVARGEITHLLDSVNLLAPAGAAGR